MKKLIGVSCFLLMGLSLQGCGLFKSDLDKLLETKECQKCDLSGANLTEARLDGANLTGANLKEANLTDVILIGANLDGADTTGAIFCRTIMPDGSKNKSEC